MLKSQRLPVRTLGLTLCLFLGACAKHESAAPTSPDQLANKAPAEVLVEKYEKSVLVCELWSERSIDGKVRNRPVDSFAIDLKRRPSIAGDVSMAFSNREHSIAVVLTLEEPKILASLALNTGAKQYVMKNTVSIPFRYSYKSKTKLNKDQFIAASGSRSYDDSIYEQVPYEVFQNREMMEPGNGRLRQGGYVDKVECVLDTKINPKFAGDYSEVSN